MTVGHIQWFADCDCGWMSKSYRSEAWAERALKEHLNASVEGHSGRSIWLLPHETMEGNKVNG